MATLHIRCPRCKKARPLASVPLSAPINPGGKGIAFLCWKCIGEVKSLNTKPKVVEK